jgi:uncharacterized membrane protein
MQSTTEELVTAPLFPDNHQTSTPLIVLLSIACLSLPLLGGLSSQYEIQGLQLAVFLALGLIVFATIAGSSSTTTEDRTFQILVWSVSLSLLLSSASFSEYLWGWDIQREFAVFQQVSRTGLWNPGNDFFYNSAISISILPTIVWAVSGLGGQEVFKFIYPLVFSIVPVMLYRIYRQVLSPKSAFLSTYLFMSYWPFYTVLIEMGKQEIGEVLLILLFLVFLSAITRKVSGAAVALTLSAGLVISHYTLSYIYLGFAAFSILCSRITRRVIAAWSLMPMLICAVMAFAWYSFVAGGSAVMILTRSLSIVVQGIVRDFFDPASRPLVALQAAGLSPVIPGFLHDLYRATNYMVQICIVVGFVVFVRKRNKSLAERKMLPLMTVALVFLGAAVVLPFFGGIPFSRVYHISLLFASPCFIIGAELLESWSRRAYNALSHNLLFFRLPFSSRGKMVVAATILLSYFLFTSGWVWAVSLDRPTSVVFDGKRMANYPEDIYVVSYYSMVDLRTDVNGAFWLKWYGEDVHLCSDYISVNHVLTAYGEFNYSLSHLYPKSSLFHYCDLRKSYVFLSELNMLHGIGLDLEDRIGGSMFIYQISPDLFTRDSNRLYSNGGTAIYAEAPWIG